MIGQLFAFVGLVLIAAGVALVYVPAGVIAAGVGCGVVWWLFGEVN